MNWSSMDWAGKRETIMPMTNGEVVVYSVERCFQDGPHDSVAVASLKNGHVSHFKE